MKARGGRALNEQMAISRKLEAMSASNSGGAAGGGGAAGAGQQAINRKRRSSINAFDQPTSINTRLRQLELDMIRMDEDRTKLFDDTHSVLAQYELKLNEIHAILKSRQDNVEKYVEDMKTLLLAKEEFEKQAKQLNEKNERICEKLARREATISGEIRLLKGRFEVLEKNRSVRSILNKSANLQSDTNDDINLDDLSPFEQKQRDEAQQSQEQRRKNSVFKLSNGLPSLGGLVSPLVGFGTKSKRIFRRKSNRVSIVTTSDDTKQADVPSDVQHPVANSNLTATSRNRVKRRLSNAVGSGLFGRFFR